MNQRVVIAGLGVYLKRPPATSDLRHALRDDLGLDSMPTIELLDTIEDACDLQIPNQNLPQRARASDCDSLRGAPAGKTGFRFSPGSRASQDTC